jgi:sulfotransferase
MDNSVVFAGLPRSGITLLASMLNKDKNIYVTTSSPFVEILWRNYSVWDDPSYKGDFSTTNLQQAKMPFLKGMTETYYAQLTDKHTVIDKRRQWQSVNNIEMFRDIYGILPKIICPVRNVTEIITSYKVLYKANNQPWDYEDLKGNAFEASYYDLVKGYDKYPECFLLVEYNDLVDNPDTTLERVYEFIGIEMPEQDFSTVEASESEGTYFLKGLHTLRNTLSKDTSDPRQVLTKKEFDKFSSWDFWR